MRWLQGETEHDYSEQSRERDGERARRREEEGVGKEASVCTREAEEVGRTMRFCLREVRIHRFIIMSARGIKYWLIEEGEAGGEGGEGGGEEELPLFLGGVVE